MFDGDSHRALHIAGKQKQVEMMHKGSTTQGGTAQGYVRGRASGATVRSRHELRVFPYL